MPSSPNSKDNSKPSKKSRKNWPVLLRQRPRLLSCSEAPPQSQDQGEEEEKESVTWTQKTTVASAIKHKVVVRGSYQQTSAENAQVDLIQSKLTISKSTTSSQIAKQQELPRLKKIRLILLILRMENRRFLLISCTWPVAEEIVTLNSWIPSVSVLTHRVKFTNQTLSKTTLNCFRNRFLKNQRRAKTYLMVLNQPAMVEVHQLSMPVTTFTTSLASATLTPTRVRDSRPANSRIKTTRLSSSSRKEANRAARDQKDTLPNGDQT